MIEVNENDDGSFNISWDPDDPKESVLNTWTETDFIEVLMDRCREVLMEESDNGDV